MPPRRTGKYSRTLIPKDFKKLWDKDHDDLTEDQRLKMVHIYLTTTQNYEIGKEDKKIPIPAFMKQQDKVKAYEAQKRKEGLEQRRQEEEAKVAQEEQAETLKETERARVAALISDWHGKKIIKLSAEERLVLENLQLKQALAEQKIEVSRKQRELLVKEEQRQEQRMQERKVEQEQFATHLGEKYEINMDVYGVDLDNGICVRADNVPCPFKPPQD